MNFFFIFNHNKIQIIIELCNKIDKFAMVFIIMIFFQKNQNGMEFNFE